MVVDELEVWEGELLFKESRELVLNGLCPLAYKNYEFIDIPSYASTRNLSVITLELSTFTLRLSLKVFPLPYLTMELGVVDERYTFLSCFFYYLRGEFFLVDTKEIVVLWVVPEDSNARHLLVEGLHILHLSFTVFFVQLCHNFNVNCRFYFSTLIAH